MLGQLKRKRFIAIGVVVTVLAGAGGAFAYFTGTTGSGTGSAAVGAAGQWGVSLGAPTFTPAGYSAIYPGAGTETIPYTITNNGSGHQMLNTLAVKIATYNGGTDAADASGNDISGCLASWFTPTLDHTTPATDVGPGLTYTGSLTLTMSDPGVSQDSCQSKAPAVVVTAS